MKRRFPILACLMAVALAMQVTIGVRAQVRVSDSPKSAQSAQDSSGRLSVIVELASDPVVIHERVARGNFNTESTGQQPDVDLTSPAARAYEARIEQEHSSFESRARVIAPNLRVVTELSKLVNAVSIEADAGEIAAISTLPGVKRVERVKEYRATLDTSVPLINAPAMWEQLGGATVAGEGMKIAILDTGIDITNPLFNDAGFTAPAGFPKFNNDNARFTNNKVIVAKSFVSNSQTADDENGHGTNVAGIAAGDLNTVSPLGLISGVAPRAYLGNYRVLGKTGSGRSDLIARAIEEAVSDGFDVLNLSLGAGADSQLNTLDLAVEGAVAAGKAVAVAAGNAGNGGVGDEETIGSPGVAPHAITVAASSNAHTVGPVITVTGPGPVGSNLVNIASTSGNAVALDGNLTSLPLVDPDPQNRGCGTFAAGSLSGKVALIERGNCSFANKVDAAAAAGARAVIVFNKDISEGDDGGETLILMDVTGTQIPSVFIRRSSGLALRDFVRSNPSATLNIAPLGSISAPGDVIASFSSRGPAPTRTLKPDLSAPGVIIYSGAIKTANADGVSDPSGFTSVSGTSQATPHVAGAAALVKQLHPTWTPEQIKSALIASATNDVFTTTSKTTRAGILAQGGGRIDVSRAGAIAATFSPANLSFGVNKLKKKPVTLTLDLAVTNQTGGQNTFNISIQQLDPNEFVTVTPSTSTVTLASGGTATVTITIFAAKQAEKRSYTGYVVVTDLTGQTLHVPYWVQYKKKV